MSQGIIFDDYFVINIELALCLNDDHWEVGLRVLLASGDRGYVLNKSLTIWQQTGGRIARKA